ncbi:MAG: hypothetical protein V4724_39700 [Pseudomonadota bacterium]
MAHNPEHEIDQSKLTRDLRPASARFSAALFRPGTFSLVMVALIAVQLVTPCLWPIWTLIVGHMVATFKERTFSMPLRIPKDLGGKDPSDYTEQVAATSWLFGLIPETRTVRTLMMAGGIFYAGYLRSQAPYERGRELWLTNADCRTHLFLAGTTGGGKSDTLMGIAYNSLCWGSGTIYGDGKASATVPFCLWSLARRLGREDDFLVLNYLTGGEDPFKAMVEREHADQTGRLHLAQSNSMNPFADGAADFLLQLTASIIPRATGENVKWQQKAVNMIDALFRALCYKRARGELEISVAIIRHYLGLQNLVTLYLEGRAGKLPELAYLPIKAYFETGLPGFRPELAEAPDKWDSEVYNQHGYMTGEFARILSLLTDTYGYIFQDRYPDVDIPDVLQNNRILVVMIPPLEKSASEAAALGKLYASQVRLSMAQDLGHQLEGTKAEVLDTNPTNAPNPYIIINDELATYFAEGMATMFAQARELNYMMVASVQDVQGLKRSDAGAESASVIANTKIKWTLALEDPEDTFELFRKVGGDAYVSVLSRHEAVNGSFSTSFKPQGQSEIEKRNRITLSELKKLNPGEGFLIFKDRVAPCASFYIPDADKKSEKLPLHINRFIQVARPRMANMPRDAQRIRGSENRFADYILAQLRRCEAPFYPTLDDPILTAVKSAASHMNEIERFSVDPVERGIVLFQAARHALHSARQSGRSGHLHQVAPLEIDDDDDD